MKKIQLVTSLLLFSFLFIAPMAVQASISVSTQQEMNSPHALSPKKAARKGLLKSWLEKRVVRKTDKVAADNQIKRTGNLSLLFGALSLLSYGIIFLNFIGVGLVLAALFALLGCILSIRTLFKIKKSEDKGQYRKAKKRAIWGLVLSLLTVLLPVAWLIILFSFSF